MSIARGDHTVWVCLSQSKSFVHLTKNNTAVTLGKRVEPYHRLNPDTQLLFKLIKRDELFIVSVAGFILQAECGDTRDVK